MKIKNLLLTIFAGAILVLFTQCNKKDNNANNYDLKFITENYAPLNYVENSELKGLAPDLLKEICKGLNIPYKVSVLSWEEGYSMALNEKNAVLFTTDLTSDRKDIFKWAGPIASFDWLFWAAPQSLITLNSLDDAKKVGRIGVLHDYSIEQYLIREGFTNLVYCTDNVDGFSKLLKGEIDLFPSEKITAEAVMTGMGKTIYNIAEKLTIKTDLSYFAFNKNVPDEVVADFQKQIDRLKENGTLKLLSQKYLHTSDFPGTLQLYTEQYPPLTFRNNSGEITGFGTDIAGEIMRRNNIFADIRLSTWSNGYDLALSNPNFCLFTMDRTPIRENLFQWVGPIGTNTTWFYTKSGSGITISSLEEARSLSSIGTVNSWYSDQYLRELGFTNLVSNSDPNIIVQKLLNGEIEAFVCSDVTFPSILHGLGYPYSEVVTNFSIMSSDFYIAFSKNTPSSMVAKWQTALDAMKNDGTYDAIFNKWLQKKNHDN